MSKEGTITVYRQLVVIQEEHLRSLKERLKTIGDSIPVIEQGLLQNKQKLAKLELEGGK